MAQLWPPTALRLRNDAVEPEAPVLYADLADSTKPVDGHIASFAAEGYKTFLHCAAKIIRQEGGTITAMVTALWRFILAMQKTRLLPGPRLRSVMLHSNVGGGSLGQVR